MSCRLDQTAFNTQELDTLLCRDSGAAKSCQVDSFERIHNGLQGKLNQMHG